MLKALMTGPYSVIHFDFPGGQYLFDARPIWGALKKKEAIMPSYGAVPKRFGPVAIAIATKGVLIHLAVVKLKTTLNELYSSPELVQAATHVLRSKDTERMKQEILLFTDAVLFEFRSYLDLVATFTYGVLKGIGKEPGKSQTLSSGTVVTLLDKYQNLKRYNLLLYLCDQVNLASGWVTLLNGDRNLFTHESAPYCAIEYIPGPPSAFDTLIMRTNITDFTTADPKDYFRISELQSIVDGMLALAPAIQDYIIKQI